MRNTKTVHRPEASAPRDSATHTLGDLRFRQLLPADDWARLPTAVRNRFSHRLGPGESIVYTGAILETRASPLGVALAWLLQAIGAPLPLEHDNPGAAAIVTVTERSDGLGQFWTRHYARRSGFPQVIHSTKTFSGHTGLEEMVGAGVTMSLDLHASANALTFVSRHFFVKLGRLRIPFPGKWCLGHITVGHIDRGGGAFEFTLLVRHPLFGCIIDQRALFHDMGLTGGTPS